jgi:urease accessory protein
MTSSLYPAPPIPIGQRVPTKFAATATIESVNHEVPLSDNQRKWLARLYLKVDHFQGKSRLVTNISEGPLRLLKPYYPEGKERIHLYLLHPPGGLVCGDQLMISIDLETHARALLTTPSAGKIYRSDALNHPQIQDMVIRCGRQTQLEWLPQENIIFSGANGIQNLTLETAVDSKFILWEIIALGRPASQAPFVNGTYTQKLQINLQEIPIFVERLQLTANSDIIKAQWGLNRQPVYGSMLAGYFAEGQCQQLLSAIRDNSAMLREAELNYRLQWSATRKDNMLIIRALAPQSEPIKEFFHRIWEFLRPPLIDKDPHLPRIWST